MITLRTIECSQHTVLPGWGSPSCTELQDFAAMADTAMARHLSCGCCTSRCTSCSAADRGCAYCRKPYHGINFVIAHDGFTLHDLVAYNVKHNDANGEGNRDGTNDNFSWNCGVVRG